jgi:hypothetical protein
VPIYGLVKGLSDMDYCLESLFMPLHIIRIMIIIFLTKNIILLRRNKSGQYKLFEFIFMVNFIIIYLTILVYYISSLVNLFLIHNKLTSNYLTYQ